MPPGAEASSARGFTLIEMMVVIGLVALMASLTLPSIMGILNAGGDAQAYNLISAQLTLARATAIEKGTYIALHIQIADAEKTGSTALLRPELQHVSYCALFLYDLGSKQFNLFRPPTQVPPGMAFGRLTTASGEATLNSGAGNPYAGQAEDLAKFTTLTVVFDSFGSAVRSIDGKPVRFNSSSSLFTDPTGGYASTNINQSQRLWKLDNTYSQDKHPVTALTMFRIAEYDAASDRLTYLNQNAQLLPLNVHTGQLYPRKELYLYLEK